MNLDVENHVDEGSQGWVENAVEKNREMQRQHESPVRLNFEALIDSFETIFLKRTC